MNNRKINKNNCNQQEDLPTAIERTFPLHSYFLHLNFKIK